MKSTESCHRPGRRAFLKRFAFASTGLIAAPLVLPSRVFGAAAPSNRLNIAAASDFGVKRDQFNRVTFTPVTTTALRLEVQLQPKFSGGILEWRMME